MWPTATARDAAQADSLYRVADYEAAAVAYEQVLASGYASADLYYNLGNAYYRCEQMGPAILNYCRALYLNPHMADAKENLALAESHTVDRITVMPRLFIVRWLDALMHCFSPRGWQWVVVVLFVIVGAIVILFVFVPKRSVRKATLIAGVFVLALWLLSIAIMIRSMHRYYAHAEAVVMTPAMTVKSSPEEQSADKMVLHEGTRLTVSDSLSGWYKIVIADGTSGWCHRDEIERI